MEGILERVKCGRVLVGDGAWGTQLMARGLPPGRPPEWFALERPELIEEVARAMVRATDRPVAIQPNAGLPVTRDGGLAYEQTPEAMAARVPELLEAGVAIVGGCCGTTPEHTAAIRRCVDVWTAARSRA